MELEVEKRGCEFWEWSREKKESDLENFRLYGKIKVKDKVGNEGIYLVEICTHDRTGVHPKGINGVSTWVEVTKFVDGLQKGDWEHSFWCKPYKKDVIDSINKMFKTSYTELKFVGEVK